MKKELIPILLREIIDFYPQIRCGGQDLNVENITKQPRRPDIDFLTPDWRQPLN